jgi:hypothetical protein
MRWEGHVARTGDRKLLTDFGGRPEGKRPLGRRKYRWVDNIIIDVEEMDWIDLAYDSARWRALVIVVMKLQFP